MELSQVMAQLEDKGNEQTKKVLGNHGAQEPYFGVKVADLKVILKGNKNNRELAEQLYATGNSDAMYLAALMTNPKEMSKETIQSWADQGDPEQRPGLALRGRAGRRRCPVEQGQAREEHLWLQLCRKI